MSHLAPPVERETSDAGGPRGPHEAWSIALGILVLVLLATLLAGPMWDRVDPGDAGRPVAARLARC